MHAREWLRVVHGLLVLAWLVALFAVAEGARWLLVAVGVVVVLLLVAWARLYSRVSHRSAD